MNAVWIALKAGELEHAIELYEQSLLLMGDIGGRQASPPYRWDWGWPPTSEANARKFSHS